MTDEIKQPDWERIEADYRAGVSSVREIAATQGVSHTAIQKRAKSNGWERDLAARIQAKADALVARREVAKQVAVETIATERQLVEANAESIATVRMAHRTDIAKSRRLANDLLEELTGQTVDKELFEQLGELMYAPDDKGMDKLNEIYRKVISLPSRIDSAKKLAETLKNLIGLEREAYGIDSRSGGEDKPPDKVDPLETARRVAFLMSKAIHHTTN